MSVTLDNNEAIEYAARHGLALCKVAIADGDRREEVCTTQIQFNWKGYH